MCVVQARWTCGQQGSACMSGCGASCPSRLTPFPTCSPPSGSSPSPSQMSQPATQTSSTLFPRSPTLPCALRQDSPQLWRTIVCPGIGVLHLFPVQQSSQGLCWLLRVALTRSCLHQHLPADLVRRQLCPRTRLPSAVLSMKRVG